MQLYLPVPGSKKYIFFTNYLVLFVGFFLLWGCAPRSHPDKPEQKDPGFFIAKQADGFYFAMERIQTAEDHQKWTSYLKENETLRDDVQKRVGAEARKHGVVLPYQFAKTPLEKAAFSAAGIERDAQRTIDWYDKAEVWMAYITDASPTSKFALTNKDRIEMSVGVLSKPNAPFQIHMGIFRGLYYIQEGQNFHKNTSVELHGFIAKVMREREPSKKYVITSPLKSMADIFLARLDKQHYRFYEFSPPNVEKPYERENLLQGQPWISKTGNDAKSSDFSFAINDRFNHQIFSLEKGDTRKKDEYDWFFATLGFSNGLYFIAELDYLASLFQTPIEQGNR